MDNFRPALEFTDGKDFMFYYYGLSRTKRNHEIVVHSPTAGFPKGFVGMKCPEGSLYLGRARHILDILKYCWNRND